MSLKNSPVQIRFNSLEELYGSVILVALSISDEIYQKNDIVFIDGSNYS